MEQDLNSFILNSLGNARGDINTYSPLALAFLGDAVLEIIVRTAVLAKGNMPADTLHAHSSHIVRATSQSALLKAVQDELTEEEADVFRRGRNANPRTHAKNASVNDYRVATGYEALLGWLYLKGEDARALELVRLGMERTGLEF